ncbi:MAG: ABC transporter ATP-binding protein [Phycisphaerales bacterium]|nr:ABC transporter ATP-binding protein [Phycisphaerales bacterium]
MMWKHALNAWKLVNEPRIRPVDHDKIHGRPLRKLLRRYYWNPFRFRVIATIVLSMSCGLWVFAYAWSGKILADGVVEVQLTENKPSAAQQADLTQPSAHQRFALEDNTPHQSLERSIEQKPGKTTEQKLRLLGWVALIMLGTEIYRHVSWYAVVGSMVTMNQRFQFRLRQNLHDKLHSLPMSYHDHHSPGRLLTHLFSDVSTLEGGMSTLFIHVPSYFMNLLAGLIIVFSVDSKLAMLVLLALPGYAISYRWFHDRLGTVHENLREREGTLNGHIANRLANFQVVKSFVRESTESVDFLRRTRPIIRNYLAATVLGTGFSVVCGLISGTCTTLLLWFGTLQVRDGRLTLGDVLMFFTAAANLFTPIAAITNLTSMFQRMRAVAGKVMRVLDEPNQLIDAAEPSPVPPRPCEIKLDQVTLHYDPARPAALREVSFVLPAGKRLCIMGPSGSGKTTLAKVLARLYDPSGGAVRFDGLDIREFPLADLRKYIGFVSQEPVVFRGTIADNIRYGSGQASMHNVVAAAQHAQIHEFIERLPSRYETITHERGLTLSGGQKQRVNLARALLYDPKVLVLDDCTSALDADTEAKLVRGFEQALRDRTVVLVSHRVSIALGCDLVLMLDKGKVVQFGPPDELAQADGPFGDLYREQLSRARSAGPALVN